VKQKNRFDRVKAGDPLLGRLKRMKSTLLSKNLFLVMPSVLSGVAVIIDDF
jgi:hypothetical protein